MENSPKYEIESPSEQPVFVTSRPHNNVHDVRLILPALALWAVTIAALRGGITGLVISSALLLVGLVIGRVSARRGYPVGQKYCGKTLLLAMCAIVAIGAPLLGLRLHWETNIEQHEVRQITGKIITRPTTYPTVRSSMTRYLLSSPEGEISLVSRDTGTPTFTPGQVVTVLAKNTERPTHHLSQGEWRLISVRNSEPSRGLWRISNSIYAHWESALTFAETAGIYDPDLHSLARGLTVGDTSGLSPDKRQAYRSAGLSHLTAVSGANVAFLLLFVGVLMKRHTPRQKTFVSILVLLIFVAVVGPEPSILRAGISGAVGVLALQKGHRKQALPALGAGIIVLLLQRPTFAVSPGFTLSVVATIGLILAAQPFRDMLCDWKVPTYFADMLSVSIVAHLVTLPLTAYFFGEISTLGIIANLVVAPILPLITGIGLAGIALSCLHGPAAAAVSACAWPTVRWVDMVGSFFGTGEWARIKVPSGLISGLVVLAIVASVVLVFTHPIWRKVTLVVVFVSALGTGGHAYLQQSTAKCLAVDDTQVVEIPYPVTAAELAKLPSATVYVQHTNVVSKRPIFTPSGVPVLRLPPGEEVVMGKGSRICTTHMAR